MEKLCIELARAIRTNWTSVTDDKVQWALHRMFSMSDEEVTENTKDKQLRLSGEITVPVPVEGGAPILIPIKHDDNWSDKKRDYKWMKQMMAGSTDANFSLSQQAAIATTFVPTEGFGLLRRCVEAHALSTPHKGIITTLPVGDILPRNDGRSQIGVEMRYYRSTNDRDEQIGDTEKQVELVFNDGVRFLRLEGGGLPERDRTKKSFKLAANTTVIAWFDRPGSIEGGYNPVEIRLSVVGLSRTPEPITFPALQGIPPKPFDSIEFECPPFLDLQGPRVDAALSSPSVDWPGHDNSVKFDFKYQVNVHPSKWTVEVVISGADSLANPGDFSLAAEYSGSLRKDFSQLKAQYPSLADCSLVLDSKEFQSGAVTGFSRPGLGVDATFNPPGVAQHISGAIGGGSAEGGHRRVTLRSFKLAIV